jgi:purine-nucleoside phosphorylase
MSTVPEVTVARMLGLRVAGVSCITNPAAGIEEVPLAHADVLETTTRVAAQFQALVRAFVGNMGQSALSSLGSRA